MTAFKGQLVFEFIIATVLFITIVIFVLNLLTSNAGIYAGQYAAHAADGKAMLVSESLVRNSDGLGLGKDWPLLDDVKIASLEAVCSSDYWRVQHDLDLLNRPDRLGSEPYDIRIAVQESGSGSVRVACGGDLPEGGVTSSVRRFALAENGETLEINVWIW